MGREKGDGIMGDAAVRGDRVLPENELCQVAAVIPAAGSGRRLGGGGSKGLLTLGGQPVLRRAIAPLLISGWLDLLVIVARAEEFETVLGVLGQDLPVPTAVVPGGAERVDSVRAGLEYLAGWPGWREEARHLVAIHDAARPLLSLELWRRVLLEALESGAAIPGLPVVNTLKKVRADGTVETTVDRAGLWEIQTPQVFRFEEILAAHHRLPRSGQSATDDAQIWEAAGGAVKVVPGERANFKITTADDLLLAEAILARGGEAD